MQKDEIIKQIKPDFEAIIGHNCPDIAAYLNIDSTKILEQWWYAKQNFISIFRNKLIYEVGEVQFHLEPKVKQEKLKSFISKIRLQYNYKDLADFLYFFQDDFFNTQITSCEYLDIVPKGVKIIKAFKYFIEDVKMLHILQNQASQLIQEDKISGILCLSVHPLDYLSLSETTYNWRSCHALDGDYCAGNLSYMCDSSTIVCYIRGKDEKELPHFGGVKWNSKKWRMLFFVNQRGNNVFAGRHYPFFCAEAMDRILDIYRFEFLFTEIKFSNWHNDYSDQYTFKTADRLYGPSMDIAEHIFMNHYAVPLEKIVFDVSNLHFNDLLNSSVYHPYYAWTSDWTPEDILKIGEYPYCPACGNHLLSSSGSLVCDHCAEEAEFRRNIQEEEYVGTCAYCDRDIHTGDVFGRYQDLLLCENCFDSYTSICAKCGRTYLTDYMNPVFDEKTQDYKYYCTDCIEERNEG